MKYEAVSLALYKTFTKTN